MKMSERLREWQLTGKVPEGQAPELAFWAGWLVGPHHGAVSVSLDERREMAARAAEFIERMARA